MVIKFSINIDSTFYEGPIYMVPDFILDRAMDECIQWCFWCLFFLPIKEFNLGNHSNSIAV